MRLTAERPADGMTAAFFPNGIDGKVFLDRLFKRFGVKLSGGQGPWKGKIFRIAHMGLVDELDVISTLAAIELVLVEMGQDVKLGCSVAAAGRVLAE
jgi:aspartate aminotransferase-like enzyme